MPWERHRLVLTVTESTKFETKYLEEYLGNWSAVLDNRGLDHVDRRLGRRTSGHNIEGRHLAHKESGCAAGNFLIGSWGYKNSIGGTLTPTT